MIKHIFALKDMNRQLFRQISAICKTTYYDRFILTVSWWLHHSPVHKIWFFYGGCAALQSIDITPISCVFCGRSIDFEEISEKPFTYPRSYFKPCVNIIFPYEVKITYMAKVKIAIFTYACIKRSNSRSTSQNCKSEGLFFLL